MPYPDTLGDLINLTLPKFDRGDVVNIALDNRHFYFAERSGLAANKITEDGGTSLKWKVKVNTNRSFEDSEMFHVNNPSRRDKTIEAEVKWTKQQVSTFWDVDEPAFQGGSDTELVDFMKLELVSLYEDFFIGMEERMWSAPSSSTTVPRRFAGIPFWLQQASATAVTNFAFSGGNPSGWTAGAGGISSSTYTNWANGTFVYGQVSDTDFITKFVEACDKTYFKAPKPSSVQSGNDAPRFAFYTAYSVLQEIRLLQRGGNDRIGNDSAKYRDTAMLRGIEVEDVPEFEISSSAAYTTAEPFFGVDWNNLKLVFQKGRNMNLLPVREAANQVTVREQYMLNWCQSKCKNRRRHFAAKRATT